VPSPRATSLRYAHGEATRALVAGSEQLRGRLDRLTRLAARVTEAPSSLITVITDRQVTLSSYGLEGTEGGVLAEGPLSSSVCRLAVARARPLVLADAAAEPAVAGMPPVQDGRVLAYLGVPLVVRGVVLGTLCVYDQRPRQWSDEQRQLVADLAESVMSELELALTAQELRDSARQLEAQRGQLEGLLERTTDGFFAVDVTWAFTYVNGAAEKGMCRSRESLLGRSLWTEFPRLTGTVFRSQYERAVAEGTPVAFEAEFAPFARVFEVRAFPSPEGLGVWFRDVTERRDLERERTLAGIAASVPAAGSLSETLDAVARAVGEGTGLSGCAVLLPRDEGSGMRVAGSYGVARHYRTSVAEQVRAGVGLPAAEVFAGGTALRFPSHPLVPGAAVLGLPLRARGRTVGVLELFCPTGGEPSGVALEVLQNLADQAAVAVDNARLLLDARERAVLAERHRLARELHDSVSQLLFSLQLHTRALQLAQRNGRDDAAIRRGLADVSQLAAASLAEMRSLLLELRPVGLGGTELAAGLRRLGETMADRLGIPVDVAVDDAVDVPAETAEHLYLIASEALHNVEKHAHATSVSLRLIGEPAARAGSAEPECWVVEIADDGDGFNPASVPGGHLGLLTMRERAWACGGELMVRSGDAGTTVRASVPASRRARGTEAATTEPGTTEPGTTEPRAGTAEAGGTP